MIVVADTTLFNYFVQLGIVELLHTLYRKVVIPRAVLQELLADGAPKPVKAWAHSLPPWIAVVTMEPDSVLSIPTLDPGETEAISLALRSQADLLLIDDASGRRIALGFGLRVIGTLGILRNAADQGLVELRETMEALRRLGFRMSDELAAQILSEL